MRDEERACPSCGHETLSWDIPCPGCAQVPWETPAGRRALGRRRAGQWVEDHGFWLVMLALLLFGLMWRLAS